MNRALSRALTPTYISPFDLNVRRTQTDIRTPRFATRLFKEITYLNKNIQTKRQTIQLTGDTTNSRTYPQSTDLSPFHNTASKSLCFHDNPTLCATSSRNIHPTHPPSLKFEHPPYTCSAAHADHTCHTKTITTPRWKDALENPVRTPPSSIPRTSQSFFDDVLLTLGFGI